MAWLLLIAALVVGTGGDRSLFDEPYNWPRIAFSGGLVVLAAVIYLLRGDDL
jgi:hypothetical protein